MRLLTSIFIMSAAFYGAICTTSNGATSVFPKVIGQNLNGKTFHLPNDFQAPASIVFIAYVRGQQAQVDSWKPFISDIRSRFPTTGEYELPTLSSGNRLLRGLIDRGMRSGIRDTETREVTITLYIDKRPFNAALGISSEREIAVLLVAPDGTVLWRATGAYTAERSKGLDAALSSLGR